MIRKAIETMTSRERVERTFAGINTDRVTIGYESNPASHTRLCEALNIPPGDNWALLKALGVDYMGFPIDYIGPEVYPQIPGRRRDPEFGAVMRYIENEFGYYWDFCDFPLMDADDEQIAAYPLPDPDHYDYEAAGAHIDKISREGFAVFAGGGGFGNIINKTGKLFGMELALMNLMTEHEATMTLLDRRLSVMLEITRRIIERHRDKLSFVWMGEDLGSQYKPLISLKMYRRVLRPRHQRFIDMAKAYELPVIVHTCGSSSWVYEDFIEMGVRGVDTLQPEAADMSPEYLAARFGGRLNFRGCISTAGPLAYGDESETEAVCKATLETIKRCGGYHFAPSHAIQDNTPVANVIAMYNAAHRYGVYQ